MASKEHRWLGKFVRPDGTNGSTHVKAKNEQQAKEKVRRFSHLPANTDVQVVRQ